MYLILRCQWTQLAASEAISPHSALVLHGMARLLHSQFRTPQPPTVLASQEAVQLSSWHARSAAPLTDGCLGRYPTSIAEDDAVVADRHAGAREKVAARLVRIEKAILQGKLLLPGWSRDICACM